MALREKVEELKLEIKKWEHDFQKKFERPPSKEDVQQCDHMRKKYKQYRYAKSKLATGDKDPAKSVSEPLKSEPVKSVSELKSFGEPEKVPEPKEGDEPDTEADTPKKQLVSVELGPTPQMQGRTLGLFEIRSFASSMSSAPSTPSRVRTHDPRNQLLSPSASSPNKQSPTTPRRKRATPSPAGLGTPQSKQTPSYLQSDQVMVLANDESPLGPPVLKPHRGLTSVIANLRKSGLDWDTLVTEDDSEDEDEDEDESIEQFLEKEQAATVPYKKKQTQKRTSRKIKMKPVLGDNDEAPVTKRRKPQENYVRLKLHNAGHKPKPRTNRRFHK